MEGWGMVGNSGSAQARQMVAHGSQNGIQHLSQIDAKKVSNMCPNWFEYESKICEPCLYLTRYYLEILVIYLEIPGRIYVVLQRIIATFRLGLILILLNV